MNLFNLFGSVPAPKLKRNKFNLSHDVKLTTDFGLLTPMMCINAVPGDTIKYSTETFCRMAPIISPIMDNISIFNYYFKVPYRLLFEEDDFNQFFVEGNSEYLPTITFTKTEAEEYLIPGSLLDFLGYPTIPMDDSGSALAPSFDGTIKFSALPLLAYNLIYNEYFRDENLVEELTIPKFNGSMSATDFDGMGLLDLRRKAYKKDYFTSALPFTQKGPQATIPISGPVRLEFDPDIPSSAVRAGVGNRMSGPIYTEDGIVTEDLTGDPLALDVTNNIKATLGPGTATINDLRYMTSLQRYLEAKARGGSRTAEWLLSIYGVRPSDLRLHRPEFLGSSKTPIVISAVDQTSSSDGVTPQGYQAGKATGYGQGQFTKVFCDEHSFVIGLSVIVPQNTYFQGCSRHLTKFDPYDYFIPQFQGLGEQSIKNQELFFDFGQTNKNSQTFGYQSRYSEYKFEPNRVHGDFKSTLNFYHLGRFFGTRPGLNQNFIEINPQVGDLNRVFAYNENQETGKFRHFWLEFYHNVYAKRPMKVFGVPSII